MKPNKLNCKFYRNNIHLIYIKRTIAFIVIVLFCINKSTAQKFYGQGGVIHDFDGEFKRELFPIEIQGLPNTINAEFGLLSVCINISHPKVSDLKVQLMSPDGTTIWLTNRNGGDKGADYLNTCFSPIGFNGYIHEGKAPFAGEFTPDSRMEFINNNQNPNEFWYLIIEDLHTTNYGNLNSFSLTFGPNPIFSKTNNCDYQNASSCVCSNTKNELLPDLVILPSFTKNQIQEYAWNDSVYPGQLRVAATIANFGEGPMEIEGSGIWKCDKNTVDSGTRCNNSELARQIINQNIYVKNENKLEKRTQVAGTMYFDEKAGHKHYHVDNWIEMRIVKKIKKKKKPSITTIGKSNKVSYCLFDTGICLDGDSLCLVKKTVYNKNNLPNYGLGNFIDCHSKAQGISVGGYDTYGMFYEGQFIDLPKGLPQGWYYLQIEVDPLKLYKEKTRTNNVFEYKIYLSKQ